MKIPRSTFALAGLTLLAPACAPAEGADVKAPTSSFLGPDARLLTPGDVCKGQASLRYFNPAAQWQQYKSVLIEPVTFWGDETSKVAPSDQQALATYFKGALDKEFGEKFQVVSEPGPGVVRVQFAITDAEAAGIPRRGTARRSGLPHDPAPAPMRAPRGGGRTTDHAADLRRASEASAGLKKYLPASQAVLLGYPKATAAQMRESFFWVKSSIEGKATYILTHLMATPDGAAYALARRQYYASTSYNGEQSVAGFLPVSDGTVGVLASHVFTDQVAGFGGSMKRSIGSSVMARKMREIFEAGRKKVGS